MMKINKNESEMKNIAFLKWKVRYWYNNIKGVSKTQFRSLYLLTYTAVR